MTDYFASASGDNSDGLTFAKAKTTISAGLALLSAGDRLFVHYTLKEAYSTAAHLALNTGTKASPCYVIAVDEASSATSGTDGDAFTYTPMAQGVTSSELDAGLTHTSGSFSIKFGGQYRFRGVNVLSTSPLYLTETDNLSISFEDCRIGSVSAAVAAVIVQSSATSVGLYDVSMYLPGTNAAITFTSGGRFEWYGGDVTGHGGSLSLFSDLSGASGTIDVQSVDFIAMPASPSLPDLLGSTSTVGALKAAFHKCLFPELAAIVAHTSVSTNDRAAMYYCHFDNYGVSPIYEYGSLGLVIESLTTYGNAVYGAASTPYSVEMDTGDAPLSNSARTPLAVELNELWLEADASLEIKATSSVSLTDVEFWIEVHGPSSSQGGKRIVQSSRAEQADEATIQTDGSSPWTGASTYNQVVSMALSGFQAGSFTIVAHLSGSEYTVNVDPEPVVYY